MLTSGGPISSRPISSVGTTSIDPPVQSHPRGQTRFVDGNFGVLAMGAAIGAAVFFSGAAVRPAAAQPTPVQSQWEFASRHLEQPQPWYAEQFRAPTVAAAHPRAQFFTRGQDEPPQPQPQVWHQQLDLVAMSPGQGTFSPEQDQFQPQPFYAKRLFAPAAAAAQPVEQWFTRGQDDPTQAQPEFWQAAPRNLAPKPSPFFATRQADPSQLQPQVWHQHLTSAVQAQPVKQFFASEQQAKDQTQPQFWRPQFRNVAPAGQQFFVPQQADPTQLDPVFHGQTPPSQATERPATRPWFARPQDDPTQLAPAVFTPTAALLPSVIPPKPLVVIDTHDGDTKRHKAKKKRDEERRQAILDAIDPPKPAQTPTKPAKAQSIPAPVAKIAENALTSDNTADLEADDEAQILTMLAQIEDQALADFLDELSRRIRSIRPRGVRDR